MRKGLHGTYYEQYWNRTKQAIYDGAINYAYSFLPTPVDPTAVKIKKPELDYFFGGKRILQSNDEESEDEEATDANSYIGYNATEAEEDEIVNATAKVEFDLIYPEPILNPNFVQYGGFLLYLIGKFHFHIL